MKIKDRVTNCTKMISKQNFVSYNQGVWNREGKEKSSWNDDLWKNIGMHLWIFTPESWDACHRQFFQDFLILDRPFLVTTKW